MARGRKKRTVKRRISRTPQAKVRRAARANKRAQRRSAARDGVRPEQGKLHYLLRNIPRGTWERFKATRPDARFDLLTYITNEVARADAAGKPAPDAAPAAEPGPAETRIEISGEPAPGTEAVLEEAKAGI